MLGCAELEQCAVFRGEGELDPNAIAAAAATELTRSFFSDLKKSSIDFFTKNYRYLFEDFDRYLSVTFNKCNYVRTIINKDKSFEIDDIYVSASFKINETICSDIDLIQKVRDGKPVAVLGFGGIGKTVFAKYLWLSIFREPKGKIPIFLEIRKFNGITDIDIKTYIRRTISPTREGVDQAMFDKFLSEGRFIFIFDGFDELAEAKKSTFSEQVVGLSYDYPENGYFISSRHDERFSSWQRFEIHKACPFTRSQVVLLLNNIPYDKDTKKKFTSEIIEKKYDSYQTFLSTPLLTLMMLMTFSQFAEVPDKRHIFYRYAFMTLYSWHDSSKESFNREKQTGLLLDQFEQAFSTFCLLSYLAGEIEFDEVGIIECLRKVKKYVSFGFDEFLLLSEITDTVNLMYKDGEKFLFTHRSFQEYFSAYAVVNYFQHKMTEIIPRVYRGSDIVLALMYEINRVVVEENYIIKEYDQFRGEIDALLNVKKPIDFCKAIGLRYIAGFYPDKKMLRLSVFGANISAKSWSYVNHLRAFFDASGDIKMTKYHDSFDPALTEQIRAALGSAKIANKYVLSLYDVNTESIKYLLKEKEDYGSLSDDIEAAIASDLSIAVSSRTFVKAMERDGQSIKAVYVAVSKLLREAKSAYARKEKSIDDLLS